MPTTQEEKHQDSLNPSEKDYQEKFDREFTDIAKNYVDETNHPLGDKEAKLADKEKSVESTGADFMKSLGNSPEETFFKSMVEAPRQGFFGKAKFAYANASNFQKGAGAGGIAAIILLIVAFFSMISVFQLIQFAEMFEDIFDAQTRRVLDSRAAKHYRIVFDEDGKSYYGKSGLRGRMFSGYASLDPKALIDDLKSKGIDIEVDNRGNFVLNGKPVQGKLSDQRNEFKQVLKQQYPDDRFMKRYTRSKTAFKSMGIQRVFFENTKKSFASWELEMISRMRQRLGVSDGSSRISVNDSKNENGPTEINSDNVADLRNNLADPSFDPGADIKPPEVKPSVDIGGILTGTVSVTGLIDGACEIKYVLKGTELLAAVIRHRALVSNAGAIMVAAHQLKTGEAVTAGQITGLMTILNRDPGIGASGSYQLMYGNKEAASKVNADKYGLRFTTGVGGFLSEANATADSVLNKVPGGPGYCRLSRNVLWQIGSGIAGVVIAIGGTATGAGAIAVLAKAGAQAAFWAFVSTVTSYLQQVIANDIAGPAAIIHYGESQGGDDSFDALAGGMLAISSGSRYQAGISQRLSKDQVANIESKIALEKNEKLKNESIFNKYFAISNTDSVLTKQLLKLPSTPKSATSRSVAALASTPTLFAKSLGLLTPQGSAKAASTVEPNPYLAQNPLSIPMYGMTDEVVNEINSNASFDPVENEQWIYDNGGIEQYQAWVTTCYPTGEDNSSMLYGLPVTEDQETDLNTKCTFGTGEQVAKSDASAQVTIASNGEDFTAVAGISTQDRERYLRYATYRMDRGLQQNLLFMSGETDCMDPDSEDWDCPNEVGTASGTFRAATFNVLGNHHTTEGGKNEGWPDGATRMEKAYQIIKDNNFAVVGLQEFEPPQREKFLQLANNEWGIHPDPARYNNFSSPNSIIWKQSEFDLVEKGYDTSLVYFGGSDLDAPWVKLKHKATGTEVYFKNTHDPANIQGQNNADRRFFNAQRHRADAIGRIDAGEKVLIVGDFNSSEELRPGVDTGLTRDQLTYCVLTKGGQFVNSFDTAASKNGADCPTRSDPKFGIDHIYHSKDLGIATWNRIDGLKDQKITDHPVVYADIEVGSTNQDGVGTADGWAWPISKQDYIAVNNCFEPAPPGTGHTGIDIPVTNKPVYAANTGVVKQAGNGGDAGNYVLIDHKNGYYTNYQHLSVIRVKPGDEVRTGEQIGISGNTGYSTGHHLHFSVTTTESLNSRTRTGSAVNPVQFLPKDRTIPCS